jgi:hypothetical protein
MCSASSQEAHILHVSRLEDANESMIGHYAQRKPEAASESMTEHYAQMKTGYSCLLWALTVK